MLEAMNTNLEQNHPKENWVEFSQLKFSLV